MVVPSLPDPVTKKEQRLLFKQLETASAKKIDPNFIRKGKVVKSSTNQSVDNLIPKDYKGFNSSQKHKKAEESPWRTHTSKLQLKLSKQNPQKIDFMTPLTRGSKTQNDFFLFVK